MKRLQNPTSFFFRQAENPPDDYHQQISKFVDRLLDKENCLLCRKKFNTTENIPRIMIHCGHTFCTACLLQFYMKRRVRCPMCLKLVKNLDNIERLPINHTIYEHLIKKNNQELIQQGKSDEVRDPSKFLFAEFERVQKAAHMMDNPQKIDPDSGLPFCIFHPDRVQHFYCQSHSTSGCRVCIEIGHSKPDCKIVDLYTVENPQRYIVGMVEPQFGMPDISQPFAKYNGKEGKFMLGLDNEEDDFMDDSSDDPKSI